MIFCSELAEFEVTYYSFCYIYKSNKKRRYHEKDFIFQFFIFYLLYIIIFFGRN